MISAFSLAKPVLHAMDPERAHNLTLTALKNGGRYFFGRPYTHKMLQSEVFGLPFPNPVGLAAGFDKNADVFSPILKLGFGFAEAGTVTPKPQYGNPKPRLFRLSEDKAVINRFGFNNKGLEYFKKNLSNRDPKAGLFGANVGANKDTEDKTADYVAGVHALYGLCDYFTVNISSPNTPGLRALQSKDSLIELIERVLAARTEKMAEGLPYTPIVIKIAPDLTTEDIADIADCATKYQIDGLIVSNTTITRENLVSTQQSEAGGLSGAPLFDLSTEVLKSVYQATSGKVPLIGVGGISSAENAYEKIRAGASLIQLYSALVYQGPSLVNEINKGLVGLLKRDGLQNITDAIGLDA